MQSAVLEPEEVDDVRIPMSKETFLNWNPDDGFLYEYDNGFAEQTTGMKKEERYITVTFRISLTPRTRTVNEPNYCRNQTFGSRINKNAFLT